jgi:hypothetical protein
LPFAFKVLMCSIPANGTKLSLVFTDIICISNLAKRSSVYVPQELAGFFKCILLTRQ